MNIVKKTLSIFMIVASLTLAACDSDSGGVDLSDDSGTQEETSEMLSQTQTLEIVGNGTPVTVEFQRMDGDPSPGGVSVEGLSLSVQGYVCTKFSVNGAAFDNMKLTLQDVENVALAEKSYFRGCDVLDPVPRIGNKTEVDESQIMFPSDISFVELSGYYPNENGVLTWVNTRFRLAE